MAADKDYLRQLAIAIRDEYRKGANTAHRVGSLLLNIIEAGVDIEELAKHFLRKDQDDKTTYLLSLLGGAIIKNWAKFGDFVTGIQGGYIDEAGNMEMESGVFRSRLLFPKSHITASLISKAVPVCLQVADARYCRMWTMATAHTPSLPI